MMEDTVTIDVQSRDFSRLPADVQSDVLEQADLMAAHTGSPGRHLVLPRALWEQLTEGDTDG